MMVASECFPLQVRGLAMGVATLLNRLISGSIALSFLSLTRALTPTGTFCLFAGIALGACAFIRRRVPETKGRALEEIEQQRCAVKKLAGKLVLTLAKRDASKPWWELRKTKGIGETGFHAIVPDAGEPHVVTV